MIPRIGRRQLSATVILLLLAGLFTPIAVLGQTGSSGQSQLSTLVAAAEASRAYADSTVALAAAHGLSVQEAQAQLAQGDSLLAAAKADADSGTNIAAGITAVQAAMSDYASAATSASVALSDAHLTAYVDYQAAVSAVAEANATISVVASAAAQACGSAAVSPNSSVLAQACAQVNAQISGARAHLSQAASILVQAEGRSNVTADLSQVLPLVALARTEAETSTSLLLTISSYTYPARAEAYVSAVILPLSARANATIVGEQSTNTTLARVRADFASYGQGEASATAGIDSSASALATAIAQVNTGAVSTSASTARSVAAQVSYQLSVLLGITGIGLLSNVVADVSALSTATVAYNSSLNATVADSDAYAHTQLPSFSTYVGEVGSNAASVRSTGSAYISAYQTLLAALDVPSVLAIPGVQVVYNALVGLQVSGSVNGVNSSLSQEVSSMGNVETDVSGLASLVASSSSSIVLDSSLVTNTSGVPAQEQTVLNATAAAAIGQAADALVATSQTAQSFVASANAATQTTIGAFASAANGLSSAAVSLNAKVQSSATALTAASAYLSSDLRARSLVASSGEAEVSQALRFFSTQNVPLGVAAMAQASVDLRAAAGVMD